MKLSDCIVESLERPRLAQMSQASRLIESALGQAGLTQYEEVNVLAMMLTRAIGNAIQQYPDHAQRLVDVSDVNDTTRKLLRDLDSSLPKPAK